MSSLRAKGASSPTRRRRIASRGRPRGPAGCEPADLASSRVTIRPAIALGDESVELAELDEPDRGLQIGHPVVEAELVEVGQQVRAAGRGGAAPRRRDGAVVAQQLGAGGELGVVGRHHAALAGRDRLARMETRSSRRRRGRRPAASIRRAGRAGGVLDDRRRVPATAARDAHPCRAQRPNRWTGIIARVRGVS